MQTTTPKRFIPLTKKAVFQLCCRDNDMNSDRTIDTVQLEQFYQLLSHVFHFEFYKVNEALKDSFGKNTSTTKSSSSSSSSFSSSSHQFVDLLNDLLNKANYERISQQELNNALDEESLFKIKLEVDFNDFSDILLFSREESIKTEKVKTWFGLSSKEIEFVHYDRVVIYLKLKQPLEQHNNDLHVLKLFENVPKADLEMLFPNTKVRMRLKDKLFIGVPALISGGIVVSTKLGASLLIIVSLLTYYLGLNQQPLEISKTEILALLAGAGAIGGYLWKQYASFKNRKLRFMQSLTQNLYFKNLDNNEGVFHRLIDEAEEAEVKEALLAYYFLLKEPNGMTKVSLDEKIEHWFLTQHNCSLNFEINDALNKLTTLKLVSLNKDILRAKPLPESLQCLNKRWDEYFNISH